MRHDEVLESEVTDPKTKLREGKASNGEGKREDRGLNDEDRGRQVGVDKRTVWGLFAKFKSPYILIQGGLCAVFRAGNNTETGETYPRKDK